MADVGWPAAAASSQGNIAGLAPVAQAETKKDMPSALSDGDAVPLPLSNHETIPSPLSDSDAIHGLDHIPPSQHQFLHFRHARLHINPPLETLLHHHTINIELIQTTDDDEAGRRRLPPVNLGKVFLGLTYQATVALMVFHFSTSIDMDNLRHSMILSFLLNFSEVAVVVGFTASLVGVLMRELVHTEMAMVAERAGSASAALGFFLMMSMFLSKLSIGIGWVCAVVSFLAFVLLFMKMRKAG
ncbi:hypothetical protein ACJRO7_012312 [Eucalyptus globulus]|uniref:Uncharacterized protein n=1 Tax=Eucalyptus globulus TaxID=34317 RepID=A0ABD3LNL0_EUCGL